MEHLLISKEEIYSTGKMALKYIFPIIICLGRLEGQTAKISFRNFTVNSGYPGGIVRDIVEDQNGFIWIASTNRLVKYDGLTFTSYKPDKNPYSFPFWGADDLILDQAGNLWIANYTAGVAKLTLDEGNFYHIKGGNSPPIPNAKRFMHVDQSNNIWMISTFDKGSYYARIDANTNNYFVYTEQPPLNSFRNIRLECVESIIDSTIWIVNNKFEIKKWNRHLDSFELVPALSEISTNNEGYVNITGDRNGLILMYTTDTLYQYHPAEHRIINKLYFSKDTNESIRPHPLNLILADAYNQYWLMHDNGSVSKIGETNGDRLPDLPFTPDGKISYTILHSDSTNILLEIKKGTIHHGESKYDKEVEGYLLYQFTDNTFRFYDSQFNDPDNEITSLSNVAFIDSRQKIWLSGQNYSLLYQSESMTATDRFLEEDTLIFIFEDHQGDIWVAGLQKVYKISEDKSISAVVNYHAENIMGIHEDSQNTIWLWTDNNLYYYENEVFRPFNFKTPGVKKKF